MTNGERSFRVTFLLMDSDSLKNIAAESSRLEEDALFSARSHFEAARSWSSLNLWLGVPTALCAGISGVAILGDFPIIAGVLSILAAALASVSTFLNAPERSAAHHAAGTRFNGLRNRTRIFRDVEVAVAPDAKACMATLKTLSDERDSLNQSSPQIPRRSFEGARIGIESGEASYRIDA